MPSAAEMHGGLAGCCGVERSRSGIMGAWDARDAHVRGALGRTGDGVICTTEAGPVSTCGFVGTSSSSNGPTTRNGALPHVRAETFVAATIPY
eukprot:6867545-Prymnesium_polylepis.1